MPPSRNGLELLDVNHLSGRAQLAGHFQMRTLEATSDVQLRRCPFERVKNYENTVIFENYSLNGRIKKAKRQARAQLLVLSAAQVRRLHQIVVAAG